MPDTFKRAVRWVLGLYVAVCSVLATLAFSGYGAVLTLFWAVDANNGREETNITAFAKLVQRAPKDINLAKYNNGDWTLLCVIGQHAARTEIERIARSQGLKFDEIEIARHGFQKSRASLVYVERSGTVRWSLPDALQGQVASGETVCVTPAAPNLTLPTPSALKALKGEPD